MRKRLKNWQSRLNQYLLQDHSFEWGKNDCVLFAVGSIQSVTGQRIKIPEYSNKVQAMKIIQMFGSLDKLIDQYLIRNKSPKRGDIVLINSNYFNGSSAGLGVCVGQNAVALSKKGLINIPMQNVLVSWSAE